MSRGRETWKARNILQGSSVICECNLLLWETPVILSVCICLLDSRLILVMGQVGWVRGVLWFVFVSPKNHVLKFCPQDGGVSEQGFVEMIRSRWQSSYDYN